jgi:hypothetical protein
MPSLKWVIIVAAVIGAVLAFLIKGGLLAPTGEESAIRPGKPVEGYHEQVTSNYLRMKQQIGDVRTQQERQSSW